ncbi:2-methylcitrate dehydratase [Exophiala viscosa]|uniref:2-methylcitrate dehydratase n=1 Tax=Exophiala viscosa TaxID=2486360 RepID=A0AAN6IC29_9EURO|nr:2-methylcitrate dehydratase [Exophiala viscosa]
MPPGSILDSAVTNGHPASNGTNGTNGANGTTSTKNIPVTSILVDFVANASTDYLTSPIRDRLKEYILDYIGVSLAASQSSDSTQPILTAIKTLGGTTGGSSTVLGLGKSFTPQYAGLLNAALGHSLDFDDTYAKGTLHAGVTAIAAGLTQAEILGSSIDMDRFLLAVAIGCEITCRLGKELGNEAYARGFHNTSTAGIFGAVATIAVLENLPATTLANAWGLAGSKAAGSMQYLANGAWNKRLHPGFAVHDAFVCVALAEAGVLGARDILEGPMGFLHAYSPKSDKDLAYLTSELGQRWEFLETSLKPFPACRMTHGFIEYATTLGRDRGVGADGVKRITLSLSPANVSVVGARIANKIHPENMVDAQFSAYYTTAHSFLYGSDAAVRAYEEDRLGDKEIYELSNKIVCVGDAGIKHFGSRIEVEYSDGKVETLDIPYPLGEPQRPFTRDRVESKFFGLVTPVLGEKRATAIRDAVEDIESHTVTKLLEMLY